MDSTLSRASRAIKKTSKKVRCSLNNVLVLPSGMTYAYTFQTSNLCNKTDLNKTDLKHLKSN